MKKWVEIDERAAIESALNNLRRYNRAMYISLDASVLNETKSVVEKYFVASEGSSEAIALEKVIGRAAIEAVYDNQDVPKQYKKKVAERTAREFIGACKAAKIDYDYTTLAYGSGIKAEQERERRHKEITVLKNYRYLDKITKKIQKAPSKIAKKATISTIVDTITDEKDETRWAKRAVYFLTDLVPDRVKDNIKDTAKKGFEKAANIIDKAIARFESTPMGQKVSNFMREKVDPIVEKGVNKVIEIASTVKQKVKSGWTALKSVFA